MTRKELIEDLSHFEHASWSHWQKYMHSVCIKNDDGSITIPADKVERWEKQMNTQYADLSEKEKQSDRDEVQKILPTIDRWAKR